MGCGGVVPQSASVICSLTPIASADTRSGVIGEYSAAPHFLTSILRVEVIDGTCDSFAVLASQLRLSAKPAKAGEIWISLAIQRTNRPSSIACSVLVCEKIILANIKQRYARSCPALSTQRIEFHFADAAAIVR